MRLGGGLIASGPLAGEGFDEESLFWRHEQLHRATIKDYTRLKSLFDDERKAMQARFVSLSESPDRRALQSCWDEHRTVIPSWVARVAGDTPHRNGATAFLKYWEKQNRLDHFPVKAI